ncbi:hypothetical protein ELD60_19835, partial [Klebsiella pneumoniae]|nr:hypothetical protein [Klebsiella pneumoniae]MBL2090502.1 hypothetical protein [Klebsiella pneumoniae]
SAQIREILISESAWEEMTCLFAPSLNSNGSFCTGLDLLRFCLGLTVCLSTRMTGGSSSPTSISSISHIGSGSGTDCCFSSFTSGATSSLTLPNTGCFRQSTHSGAAPLSIALMSRSKSKLSGVSGSIVHLLDRPDSVATTNPTFFNFATIRVAVDELIPILAPS